MLDDGWVTALVSDYLSLIERALYSTVYWCRRDTGYGYKKYGILVSVGCALNKAGECVSARMHMYAYQIPLGVNGGFRISSQKSTERERNSSRTRGWFDVSDSI